MVVIPSEAHAQRARSRGIAVIPIEGDEGIKGAGIRMLLAAACSSPDPLIPGPRIPVVIAHPTFA